jgi:hypothetical protein
MLLPPLRIPPFAAWTMVAEHSTSRKRLLASFIMLNVFLSFKNTSKCEMQSSWRLERVKRDGQVSYLQFSKTKKRFQASCYPFEFSLFNFYKACTGKNVFGRERWLRSRGKIILVDSYHDKLGKK